MTQIIPTSKLATIPPRRNGNEGAEQLPEHRQKIVEAGNAAYQKLAAERDELDGKLSEACKTIAELTVQLDALKSVVNMMESSYLQTKLEMENRISTYQAERDEAVSRYARLEATLMNLHVVIQKHISESEDARI